MVRMGSNAATRRHAIVRMLPRWRAIPGDSLARNGQIRDHGAAQQRLVGEHWLARSSRTNGFALRHTCCGHVEGNFSQRAERLNADRDRAFDRVDRRSGAAEVVADAHRTLAVATGMVHTPTLRHFVVLSNDRR